MILFQGSSISFGYGSTPPDPMKIGKNSTNISSCPAQAVTSQTGQVGEMGRSSGSDQDQQQGVLLDTERKKVSTLEATLVTKEKELGKLRLDLASSQSSLELAQKDLKLSTSECSKRETELAKLQLELQTNTNKVSDNYGLPAGDYSTFF